VVTPINAQPKPELLGEKLCAIRGINSLPLYKLLQRNECIKKGKLRRANAKLEAEKAERERLKLEAEKAEKERAMLERVEEEKAFAEAERLQREKEKELIKDNKLNEITIAVSLLR
jgi:hypothetical protein